MKTLIILSAALLITFSSTAFATNYAKADKRNMSYTVYKYIDALSYGKVKGMADVLDPRAKFTITGGSKTRNYTREQILASFKDVRSIQQNCTTSYKIIELNDAQAVVKVTMKYEGFSRVNFLNMANTAAGWKITNVSSSFI